VEQRAAAPVLHRALAAAREAYDQGEREGAVLRGMMGEILAIEPLGQVEYVSCADAMTLRETQRIEGPSLLSTAVIFGTTRLIDNVTLRAEE
jgi:pantoate--beta-alanine ligase